MFEWFTAYFKRNKQQNFTGLVKEMGLNEEGEIIVVLELQDGNFFELKRHLAKHRNNLIFNTEPILIGDSNERN